MSAMPPVSPSPEIVPALDESRPVVGPNLAGDPDFCQDVASKIYREAAYPYLLQQQQLWLIWQLIDDAWRVKLRTSALNISSTDPKLYPKVPDGKGKDGGMTSYVDGYSAKVQPPTIFKQVKTKTDMHMSIAYADGIPVRAVVPETIFEHPLYDPTEQSAKAANELIRQNAEDVDLQVEDRKGRGCWSKYGFVNVATDFEYQLEDMPMGFRLPPDPQQAQMMIQAEMQRFGGPPRMQPRPDGMYAVWTQKTVKKMQTKFVPLRHDDVFMDLTMGGGIQRQPCPCVREHCFKEELLGNDYDPVSNPFGWLNAQDAYRNRQTQWTLSAQDEVNLRQELLKKWNQDSQGQVPNMQAIKQRWTCYPWLSIVTGVDGKMKLDNGEGLECPTCHGQKSIEAPAGMDPATGEPQGSQMVPCPQCQGVGRIFGNPERYVVQFFGLLMTGGATGKDQGCTVLRIQKLPSKTLPLIFASHLFEDDSGAIPMSLVEASISSYLQLATARNQFLNWTNKMVDPPWMVPEGSGLKAKDLNVVNGTNEYEGNPNSIFPMNLGSIDARNFLNEFASVTENDIQQIIGMTDQLLGMVENGRRSASEITTAFDAAKMPITEEIDSYNRQVIAPWAQQHLDNVEAWADRDWIQRKTGRTTFGKVKLFTKIADEFMKKMGLIQNTRYVLEASVNDPSINRAELWMQLLELTGLPDPGRIVNDGGLRKAQMDGMKIVARILGDGVPVPPDMSDPDEIYIPIFQEALKDPYWQEKTPETLPILNQRLQLQMLQAQMKQMQAMQQQLQQNAVMNPPEEQGGNGNQPKTPNKTPKTKTQANQQMAGAAQG